MNFIVFVSQLEQKEQQQWLALFKKLIPNEQVLLPEEVPVAQINKVDIAIVANPDPKILAQYPNLVWIQSLWAGVERLVSQLNNPEIKLVRLIDPQLAKTMAEACLAWTLYLHRLMPQYAIQQQNKCWRQLPCATAEQTNISFLGAGKLGLAAIELLKPIGYQLNCWTRSSKDIVGVNTFTGESGLTSLLKKTDILINLLPLTPQTDKFLNATRLTLLPQGAKVINFSRGAVLDTKALIALLDCDHLAHAVLDVFEQEPLKPSSGLWHHEKITVLPHISAPTNITSAAQIVCQNIINYREDGRLPTLVDWQQGY